MIHHYSQRNSIVCVCALSRFSRVGLFATLWTIDNQVPLSMGFPRQEYWSGLPFSFPGYLPDPGIEPTSPALAGRFFTTSTNRYYLLLFYSCGSQGKVVAHSWDEAVWDLNSELWNIK